jgi:hypothetical protein
VSLAIPLVLSVLCAVHFVTYKIRILPQELKQRGQRMDFSENDEVSSPFDFAVDFRSAIARRP